ncbi:MAG: prepilin-type N-terminal cleavage/methylation domain-containing protein [Acidobacteria bacterium]|nr:prepilin-type N-terminal cleavage/methylation domain-containing protein [Acidobacteriota bacterium]
MSPAIAARVRAVRGFTVIELLVGMVLLLLVMTAAFDLLQAAQTAFVTQPDATDLQQRLRVVADAMARDLVSAGAGRTRGAARGPLIDILAPILPYRAGLRDPDAPGSFCTDRLTITYVPPAAPQTTTRDPIAAPTATIRVNGDPGCAVGDEACGFTSGMAVLVADAGGRFNMFTVASVSGAFLALQLRDPALATTFPPGAHIVEIAVHSYLLKTGSSPEIAQVAHYDGYRSEQPLSDDIVDLQAEYFGDPQPPLLSRPVSDPQGPRTTYGPAPPALDTDDPRDTWPAGENCVFAAQAGMHVARLPALGDAGSGLVPLAAQALTDGPWCPDSQSPNRFDADLLRVRRVRVSFRAQAVSRSLRGASASLFVHPGTSPGGGLMVPDARIVVDVTPRNMNARR